MATKKAEPKITTAEAEELLFGRVHLNDVFNALVVARKAHAAALLALAKKLQEETLELEKLTREIEL